LVAFTTAISASLICTDLSADRALNEFKGGEKVAVIELVEHASKPKSERSMSSVQEFRLTH